MNSLIISGIYSFIIYIVGLVRKSFLWRGLSKIHSFFRDSFQNSFLVKLIKSRGETVYRNTSVFCRLLQFPTAVVSALLKLIAPFIKSFSENSPIAKMGKGFVDSFLSINLRFFGLIIGSAGVSGFIVALITGKPLLNKLALVLVGAVLFLFKVKLADYLDNSFFVRLFKSIFSFNETSFKIYNDKIPFGYSAVAGIIAGLLAGLGAVNIFLYAIPLALFGMLVVLIYPICGIFFAFFLAPILPTMAVVGICVLTIFASLGNRLISGKYKINLGRVGIFLTLFLVIALISTVFSFSTKGSIGVLGMYLIFISFYLCIRNNVFTKERVIGLLKIVSISAFAVSAYGIMQYLFGWTTKNAWIDEEMFEEATMRVYSTLANPNVLGEYLILALPICATVILEYTKNTFQKIVYGLMFVAILLCLVLTQSRGCWIGFFVSVVIFVTYYKSELWKVLPIFIILLPLVLPETIINRFLSVGDMSDSSTSYRVYIWMGTIKMLKHFWIGGIGLGEKAFRFVYPYYSYSGIVAPHSHNLYLQFIVESGVAELVVFIVAMLIFMKNMVNTQGTGKKYGIVATAILSAIIGFLVQSMFDYTFYNYRVMGFFFMILALGNSVYAMSEDERRKADKI